MVCLYVFVHADATRATVQWFVLQQDWSPALLLTGPAVGLFSAAPSKNCSSACR